MTTAANIPRRFQRSLPSHAATHLFTLGQAVQLKDGLWGSGKIYLITAKLPPNGDSLQYRIRNDDEQFERVAMQANLDAVGTPIGGEGDSLVEKSPGLGQGT